MTQPLSKRLVSEARLNDVITTASNAATAAAQSQIDASAAAAASSATAAQNSATLVGAPAGNAIAANLNAKGTVSDQDYTTLEDALTATPTGGTLEVSKAWSRSTTWTIGKSCTVKFIKGGSITTTVAAIAAITVAANDVTLDAPKLTGTSGTVYTAGARGIAASGTLAAYITGLRIRAPRITTFTDIGINLQFVSQFSIERPAIDTIAYAGIMLSSCAEGRVDSGYVKNVTQPSGVTNSYGIAASFNEVSGITASPQSRDIKITGLVVDGVPNWEGIDTHAGINIEVTGCTVNNCKVGIAIVPGRNGGANYVLAPKNAKVHGNIVDSGRSDGVLSQGISFVGCSTAVGFFNNSDWATGSIIGNTIKRCGNDAATSGAALSMQDTQGVVVASNVFEEPVGTAIRLDYNNKDAVITGNTCTDVWTNTQAFAVMVFTNSAWNTAKVAGGNTLIRGAKSATIVNSGGLRIGSATATVVVEQGNDFLTATSPYSLATPLIRFDLHGIRHSYVTAIPTSGIWQAGGQALLTTPAASSSPGWVCTTAGGGSSATWAASTVYSGSTWVKTSTGKVLECVVGGTSSATEPSPTTLGATVTDGTVTWVYRSATSAVFKTMPSLGA